MKNMLNFVIVVCLSVYDVFAYECIMWGGEVEVRGPRFFSLFALFGGGGGRRRGKKEEEEEDEEEEEKEEEVIVVYLAHSISG